MFLALLSSVAMAVDGINSTKVWPKDDGSTKAYTKTTDKIYVIFGEAVKAGTSGFVRLNDTNGAVRIITPTDSRISYAKEDTVVIDFSADQKELMTYTVSVDNGAFVPVASTSGTVASVATWSYTVGDYTGPTLKTVVPAKDAKVAQTISLTMTFDDASGAYALGTTGKIAVYKSDGNVWDLVDLSNLGSHTVTISGAVVTVTGIRAFEDLTSYAVTVDAGIVTDNGLRADGKKNPYAGLTDRSVWKFSSKDFSVPGYATDYPKAGNIGDTSFDLLVKTTESGSFYAKAYTAEQTVDGALLTDLTATTAVTVTAGTEAKKSFSSLTKDTKYYVYVVTKNSDVAAAITDISGPVEVTTIDKDKPVLATVSYVKGTSAPNTATVTSNTVTNTVINQSIDKIVFNFTDATKVSVGTGSIIVYKKSDNSVYTTIDASAISMNSAGTAATAKLSKVFENNAGYYAFIPSTLFKDTYNNFYGGITSTTGWQFTTNDNVAPTITSFSPAQGASAVKLDAKIIIAFSEIINLPSSGSTNALFAVEVNGSAVSYTYAHSNNNNTFSTVTITPDAAFASSGVVTVTVNGAVADMTGNTMGLTQGVSFVAEDKEGPTVDSWTTSPIDPSTNIVIKFDEPIRLGDGTAITATNLYTIMTVKMTDANGENVSANYSISDDKTTITVSPVELWASKGTYYVAISSNIEDMSGNLLDNATTRSKTYTIKDVVPATVSINVDGKTDVDVAGPVTISFKEGSTLDPVAQLYYGGAWHAYTLAAMDQVVVLKENDANGANVPFTVASGDDAAFTINAAYTGAKTYYVGIGASTKDAGGNVNAAKFATFSTKFVAAPELVSVSPENEATAVALKATLVATFNTDIAKVAEVSYTSPVTINGAPVAYADLVVSGKTLTVKHGDFASGTGGTDYEVIVPTGVVLNKASSAPFTGIASGEWMFTSVDQLFEAFTLAPDGATLANLDDKLVISVPEKVVAGTGNISIRNAVNDFLIEQISSTASNVAISYSGSATTIKITPSANFVYGGSYYVEVDNGAFVDLAGNKIPAIHGKTSDGVGTGTWTFDAVDTDLAVDKVSPYMVENVATDADIVITFNRAIKLGTTGSVGFVETTFGDETTVTQPVNYGVTSSNLIISGNTLTIKHPDHPFTANRTVFVILESGAIVANSSTNSSTTAIVKADNQKFYVGDNLPPVATVNPTWDADAKNYSAVNTNITITFNEDVLNAVTGLALTNDNVTYNGGVIELLDGSLASVDFQGSVSGRVITIDPTSDLSQSTTYTVRILANTIKDTHSHVITGVVDNIFKTVDTTVPTVSATLVGGAKSVNVTSVSVTDANPKSFYYVLQKESDPAITAAADVKANGKKLDATVAISNFTISSLDPSTSYVLYYIAEDTFGNLTSVKTSKASTDDTVPPVLASTDPANGTMDVDNAKAIVLTFNEDVVVNGSATGKIYIKDKATSAIIETLDVAALAQGSSSKKIALTTGFPAMAPVLVYVEMDADMILDAHANAFAGISGADMLYFTYEDNQAPTISDFTFTGDDDTHVALSSNLVVVFSENVQAGAGNAILYKGAVDPANAIEVFKGSEVSISGNSVTVNPTLNFDPNTTYNLEVQAGFVKDVSSKKNNCVTGTETFTTGLDIAPTVAASPAAFTDHAKSELQTITLTFDANVYLKIAGLNKSLAVLTSSDIQSMVSFAKADGTAVPYTVASHNATQIVLNVAADKLDHLTSYVLTVSGFRSQGDLVMETKVFNYTTGDGAVPVITFNPADEAENVVATTPLTLTFSKNIYHSVTDGGLFYVPFTNDNVGSIVYLYDETAESDVAFVATFNGTNMITLTPKASLVSGHVYSYGIVSEESVTDIKGNELMGGDPGTSAMFTVLDTEKPVATVDATNVSPVPAATSVVADADMWIKFNEKVKVGTGSITIRHEDGTIFQTISGSDLSISADDNKVLVIAHTDFESDAVYFVEIGAGVVTDMAGNANVAMTDPTKWTFTTKDTFELTATVTPEGDNTPRNVNLTLSFNKVPEAQSNKFIAIYKADGTAVYQKAVSGLSIVGKDAIWAGVALDPDQAYYARVEANAFMDEAGNKFAGIMDNSWVFSTVDNIAPKLVSTNGLMPANNATAVDQATQLVMTFDRPILAGTGSITVRHKSDASVFATLDVADAMIDGSVLTFTLPEVLEKSTDYYVLVPAGIVTNTEVTLDPYAGINNTYDWTFTTGNDEVAPTLLSVEPNAVTNVDIATASLVATFSEKVMLGAGNLVIYNAAADTVVESIALTSAMIDGAVLTVAPTKLAESTSYYVMIDAGAVKDLVGNEFAGITDKTTWAFSTSDFTAPVLVTATPNAETIADNHPTLVMNFNEDVELGTGNVVIVKKDDHVTALTLPISSATVSGKTVTITYVYDATAGGLDQNTDYYVLVDAGAVKDMTGNEFAGVTDMAAWTFKTGGFATPVDPIVNSSLKVYPNPFVEYVNIDGASQLSKVVISNIAGQVVKEVVNPTNRIQLNELRSGVYFISMYKSNNVIAQTAKIVKR